MIQTAFLKSIRRGRSGLLAGLLALIAGCATPPAPESNPLEATQAAGVRFLHVPPPNARFIAKIVYSSGDHENWQSNCINYLSAKAVKLGGNVVVPGVELDFGSHRLYADQLSGPPSDFVIQNEINGRDPYGYPQAGGSVIVPSRFHFWSNVYYCPR